MELVKSARRFTLRLAVVMLQSGLVLAEPQVSETRWGHEADRLLSLETRVANLEDKLQSILDRLERLSEPADAEINKQLRSAVGETAELSAAVATAEPGQPGQAVSVRPSTSLQAPDRSADPFPKRVDYGGYMEMHVNHDNVNPTTLDFHRFVLLYGHQFTDRIRFVGELELEHALVEGGQRSGELELEQAYLDFLLTPRLSFRAGMMLTPIGIVNERHEPASFNGVERPFVDTVIIPSTWFSQGAGLVGDLGSGFSFKAFAASSLNAVEFSASEGFRGGRQKGFFDDARHLAAVARLEYAGVPDLNLGASFWMGNTGFGFDLSGRAKIFEFDGQYDWKRLSFRGQFAQTFLENAMELNRLQQLQRGINPNLAAAMRGFYLEGAANVLPERIAHRFTGFYRYENFDTQYRMPAGFLPLRQFDRFAHVVGMSYFPHPDIAIKFDYDFMGNESSVVRIPNRWNLGIGWWF